LRRSAALAHQEIRAAICAGGMGEVYRAIDSKRGRDVAGKCCLRPWQGDPDYRARFWRTSFAPAAANGQPGEREAASEAVGDRLALKTQLFSDCATRSPQAG
jgi:hypothetical protein